MDTNINNPQTLPETSSTPQSNPPKETVKEIHHHHYRERGRFFSSFIWGVFIIFLGLMFLAQAAGWVQAADIGVFFARFWPVFIILIGLSILSRGGFVAGLMSMVILVAVLAFVAAYIFNFPVFGGRIQRISSDAQEVQTREISIDKQDAAQTAGITVNAGAGQLNISGGSDKLVSGSLVSNFMDLETSSQLTGSVQNVDIRTNGSGWNIGGRFTNTLTVNLSTTTPMDVRLDAGASTQNLDFSEVQLRNLDIHAGASSVNLVLGDKADNVVVNLDSGASSVRITLPKGVGAKVKTSGGLTSRNFAGLKQINNDLYQSDNYDQSPKKADITLRGGASSYTINWK